MVAWNEISVVFLRRCALENRLLVTSVGGNWRTCEKLEYLGEAEDSVALVGMRSEASLLQLRGMGCGNCSKLLLHQVPALTGAAVDRFETV